MPDRRALVIGATGSITGGNTVRRLLDTGWEVYDAARRASAPLPRPRRRTRRSTASTGTRPHWHNMWQVVASGITPVQVTEEGRA
jgi:NAD(P)-dependent dehydrogenase (short-subunit alcohol dehydrogenase family)